MYLHINFLSYVYFTFFIKRKRGNQLKICSVYLLADEKAYIDYLYVIVFSQNKTAFQSKADYPRMCVFIRNESILGILMGPIGPTGISCEWELLS